MYTAIHATGQIWTKVRRTYLWSYCSIHY